LINQSYNSILTEIFNYLEDEVSLLLKLQKTSRLERESLTFFQIEKLQELSFKRSELIEALAKSAIKRRDIEKKLALDLNIIGETPRLSILVKRLPDQKISDILSKTIQNYIKLLTQVTQETKEFESLALSSMRLVGGALSLLRTSHVTNLPVYTATGKSTVKSHRSVPASKVTMKEI
jgi:hypothetical protein